VAVEDAVNPDDLTPEQLAELWEEDRPPAAGPLANLAAALAVAAVGTAGIVGSLALGLGTPAAPKPGMWPFIISLVLVVLAAAQAVFGRKSRDAEKFSGSSWQVLAGLATMIGFVLLVGTIGFEIPALLLTFIWLKFLGKETWRMSVVLSFAVVAAFYLIFVMALSVPIPHLL
jgi:Tripartite tricarboxylate transporter TctB family